MYLVIDQLDRFIKAISFAYVPCFPPTRLQYFHLLASPEDSIDCFCLFLLFVGCKSVCDGVVGESSEVRRVNSGF